jgi:putative membrane protein
MLVNIIVGLVAFLHVYFLFLEMFMWTKPLGLKVFNQSKERAVGTAGLAANQGLYNGFLAAGLIWGLIHNNEIFAFQIKAYFLTCVIIAGLYGAYSVNKKIFFIQALPAIIALILMVGGGYPTLV